jgi:hypothetical protein
MYADPIADAARLREQMTRPERESTRRTECVAVEDHDRKIEDEQTRRRLPLFESNRATAVAELERRRLMIARQLCVAELSLIGPQRPA